MGKREGIMLATPLEERRLTDPKFNWVFPCFAQAKLDGVRCIAKPDVMSVYSLFTSENNGIMGLADIEVALELLRKKFAEKFGDMDFVFDGELYNHYMTFEQICSGVKKQSEKTKMLEFHIFDYFTYSVYEKRSYVEVFRYRKRVLESLELILKENPELALRVKIVPCLEISCLREMYIEFNRLVKLGYEGIIVRHPDLPYEFKRSLKMLKYKTKNMDSYRVVDFREAFGKDGTSLGRLGSLTLIDEENNSFDVAASALTHKQSEFCFSQIVKITRENLDIDITAVIGYQTMTEAKVPKFVGKLALIFYRDGLPILVVGSFIPRLTDLVMPKPEHFGYINAEVGNFTNEKGVGWVVEGGEEEYTKSFVDWQNNIIEFVGAIR